MRTPSVCVAAVATLCITLSGCVTQADHKRALDTAAKLRQNLEGQLEEIQSLKEELAEKSTQLEEQLGETSAELEAKAALLEDTSTQLASAEAQTEQLSGQVSRLSEAEKKLLTQRAELAKEVAELKRLRAAAERRNAEFKRLLKRLAKMIDAGSLEVKIRNGRMLVTMSSDVLFEPAKAELKKEAVIAITQLAVTLKTFKNRRFQVAGHSDSRPIHNDEWDSNWELSAQRAIEVVKVLIDGGVPSDIISAAGYADSEPVASNRNRKGRSRNRRVELVFMPKIDELPGFAKALKE